MPLPFILAGAAAIVSSLSATTVVTGAAVATGVYGIKKGLDAKSDLDDAERINEDARERFDGAKRSLEHHKKQTQSDLESLGRQKILLYRDALTPFVETFQQIKEVDYEDKGIQIEILETTADEILVIRQISIRMEDVVGGTAGAIGSGALAGLAAYGSVGLLGTASTGTAIAGLSGAAATNATLAWLGGGSVAAGGIGMAGGAAVLGGIVAAPVLLVGGFLMASEAEEAKNNALSNRHKAEEAATAMEEAEVAARYICRKAAEVRNVLERLKDYLISDLDALEELVSHRTDYRTFNGPERELVHRTASLAVTAKNLAETPLLEENGSVTNAIRQELKESKRSLKALGAVTSET